MNTSDPGRTRDRALAGLVLAAVYVALLSRFDLRLLFTDTILTGGDSASWYQPLEKLKNEFLPRLSVSGYSLSNFFGYLEGTQYFPLPFLGAALAGFLMPLTVALKLATFAGCAALPASLFLSARAAAGSLRAAALASALSLPFLFNESYTMFGGNWLSTFAGEFCYSWAIALLPPFIASVMRDRESGRARSGFLSGFILGAMGLCHLFVFMPAFFLPFLPALELGLRLIAKSPIDDRRAAADMKRILITYATAFCVMGFWFIPMAATRAWAQPISMIWRFASFSDFLTQTGAIAWAPCAAAFALAAISGTPRSAAGNRAAGNRATIFSYGLSACAFLFAAAPGMGMPDIRFVPTALVLCAFGLSVILPPKRWAIPFAAAAACIAFVPVMSRNAPHWFRWNYSGYEAKAQWPAMKELAARYQGSDDSGRILWEKQNQRDNADFGSERAFENLELFTGRPSAEGVHYGSSFMARATTWLQSSYSPNPVDPEAERIYSIVDPEAWPARFLQANARYIITHSEQITALFAAHPRFRLDSRAGKFSVFEFSEFPGSYVEVAAPGDISVVAPGPGGWRADYYRHFREYERYPRTFVSAAFADTAMPRAEAFSSYGAFASASASNSAPSAPASARSGPGPISDERVDDAMVRFTTAKPGMPHIVKISWAPGWRSDGGERLYPVAPGFILIIPKRSGVTLRFGRTGWDWAGIALSLIGTAALAYCARLPVPNAARDGSSGTGVPWKILLAAGLLLFSASAALLAVRAARGPQAIAADIGAARRLDLSDAKNRRAALALTERWATAENLGIHDNLLSFDAYRIRAMALYRDGKTAEAKAIVDMLRDRYPHSRAAAALPFLP